MRWPKVVPVQEKAPPPRIALVFGSGGARGWAHVGVMRAMAELEFVPDLVVGTSVGSIAAAAYASGSQQALEELARDMDWRRAATLFFEFGLPKSGLVEGRRVMELLHKIIPEGRIDRLAVPYAAVATDLRSHQEVVIAEGSVFEAIRASISIPGVFTPVHCEGRWLVDGGLVNPLPISVARGLGATHVVAIDINLVVGPEDEAVAGGVAHPSDGTGVVDTVTRWVQRATLHKEEDASDMGVRTFLEGLFGLSGQVRRDASPTLLEVVTRSLRAGENAITRERLLREPPDLLIQPSVGHVSTLDFQRSATTIQAGYEATMVHADALRGLRARLG